MSKPFRESKTQRRTHALALSGGGVHGAFEAGLMKCLFAGRSPGTGGRLIEARIFTGSSMGAYNAALIVSQAGKLCAQAADYLEKTWAERIAENSHQCGNGVFRFVADPLDFLDPRCFINWPSTPLRRFRDDAVLLTKSVSTALFEIGANVLQSDGNLREQVLNYLDFSGLVTTEPLKKLIGETIDLPAIQKSEKVLKVTATNWTKGELRIFGNADMEAKRGRNILLGAAAVPAVMPRVLIDGKFHHDAGLIAGSPLKPAYDAGADVIHAAILEPQAKGVPPDALENTIEIIARERVLAGASIAKREIAEIGRRNRQLSAFHQTDSIPGALRGIYEDLTAEQNRPLEIHVYRPAAETPGFFDLLDFRKSTVERLIELGFEAAESHDCGKNGCIIPD